MAQNSVTVKQLVDNTRLEIVAGNQYLERPITTSDISRPGLEMTGYFN
ncbi:MAG: HPr(Ser) kinase/phosphatase, partial [Leuconostoc citreum]